MTDVTLEELNRIGEQIKHHRAAKAMIKEEMDAVNGKLRELETTFIAYLQQNGMEKYVIPGFGTAYIKTMFSYKIPKTPEQKTAFFGYLKERGIFDSMATVHSRTLNSWAKEEMAKAIEAGSSDFQIPGLEIPTTSETLGVRK